MTRFIVDLRVWDYDGYYTSIAPRQAPLPGAVLIERWTEEKRKREYYTDKKARAALNDKGEPIIVYDRVEREIFPSAFSGYSTMEQWRAKGRNHREDREYYYREFSDDFWVIDVETVDDLIALLKLDESATVQVDDAGNPTIVILRDK